jgi:hypothetical protein
LGTATDRLSINRHQQDCQCREELNNGNHGQVVSEDDRDGERRCRSWRSGLWFIRDRSSARPGRPCKHTSAPSLQYVESPWRPASSWPHWAQTRMVFMGETIPGSHAESTQLTSLPSMEVWRSWLRDRERSHVEAAG